MTNFDVVAHLDSNVYAGAEVTEVPNTLTVEAEGSARSYYLDPLMDDSSLLWVYLTSDTFNELLPGYHWCVDNPGILYAQTYPNGQLIEKDDGEPIVSLELMQPVAEELLERYRAVVAHLS